MGSYTLLSWRQHASNPDDRSIPTWTHLWQDGVVKVFSEDERSGTRWIWEDAKATFLERLFSGLAVGVVLSVVIGILMGCYAPVEALLLPPLAFLAKIPPTAMLAVFFVMVGTDYEMYVTMIAFGVVPVLAQSLYHAAKEDVPAELLDKAYTLGASQAEVIWCVIYKHILPRILDGIRLQVGPAMVYLIAAEMLVGDVGFGYHIRLQQRLLDMSVVYVYLIILGAAGFLMDSALTFTRRRLCPWYGR
jgi:NitT/TauT family transport system permease protein